jgi:hypothetical protein
MAVTMGTLARWPGQEYVCMSRVFAAYAAGGLLEPALGAIGGIRAPFLAYLGLLVLGVAAAQRCVGRRVGGPFGRTEAP